MKNHSPTFNLSTNFLVGNSQPNISDELLNLAQGNLCDQAGGKENLAGVGGNSAGQLSNFLDFFASFLCQDKNEEPPGMPDHRLEGIDERTTQIIP